MLLGNKKTALLYVLLATVLIVGVTRTRKTSSIGMLVTICYKEHEGGRKAADVVRECNITGQTFYRWKSKYGG
jgi:hypothetical protein